MTLPILPERGGALSGLMEGLTGGMQQALPSIQEMILSKTKQKQMMEMYPNLFVKKNLSPPSPNIQGDSNASPDLSMQSSQGNINSPRFTEEDAAKAAITGNEPMLQFINQGLKRQQTEQHQQQAFANEINKPIITEYHAESKKLAAQRANINAAKLAIKDTGYFSKANLSEILNNLTDNKFNLPPDASGAQLMAAGKNFLIETTSKVGAKGLNQYLEKQIQDAQAKIGRSEEANMASILLSEAPIDIQEKYNQNLSSLIEKYTSQGLPIPLNISDEASKMTKDYANKRLDRLSYDLQSNLEKTKSLDEKKKLKKVTPGTMLTVEMAGILLDKYKDPKEAEKVAKQLGYTIPESEIYMGIQ